MSKLLMQKENQVKALVNEVEEMSEQAELAGRDITARERKRMESITCSGGELAVLNTEIATLKRTFNAEVVRVATPRLEQQMREAGISSSRQKVSSVFESGQDAYDAGQFFAARLFGSERALQHCRDHGLISNSMSEGVNSAGGFSVPAEIEHAIVSLREEFGVARRETRVVQMGSDTLLVPKNAGELTSYFVSENNAITQSDMVISQISLVCKKLATLTAISSELNDDSVVSMADELTKSIAYSFSLKEDGCLFLGDGSSTYGGMTGLENKLLAGSVQTAGASRVDFGTLTLADFENAIGKAKQWVGSKSKWYISQAGWANSMQRLLDAAGGNSLISLAMGAEKTFLGFPVVISQVLPSALTGTTGTTACYFGDLKSGVILGSRRGISVAVDQSLYFNQDAIAVRGTERFDIACHDIGTASAPGGIIKLKFA